MDYFGFYKRHYRDTGGKSVHPLMKNGLQQWLMTGWYSLYWTSLINTHKLTVTSSFCSAKSWWSTWTDHSSCSELSINFRVPEGKKRCTYDIKVQFYACLYAAAIWNKEHQITRNAFKKCFLVNTDSETCFWCLLWQLSESSDFYSKGKATMKSYKSFIRKQNESDKRARQNEVDPEFSPNCKHLLANKGEKINAALRTLPHCGILDKKIPEMMNRNWNTASNSLS